MSAGMGPRGGGGTDTNGTRPEPTVMVTGCTDGPLRRVALRLFGERARAADGAVVATTREAPGDVARQLSASGGFARDRLAVVDARGAGPEVEADVGRVLRVEPPPAPAELDRAVEAGLEALTELGVARRHFLYHSLGVEPSSEPEAAYDRAYELAMTVGAEEGLALFTARADGLPADTVEELSHLFDVHLELRRRDGGTELRWTGLVDASDGWLPLGDAELGPGGFR